MDNLRSSNILPEEIKATDPTEVIAKNKFIDIVKNHFSLIIFVTLGITAIAGLSTLVMPSKYQSKFQLLIDKEAKKQDFIPVNVKEFKHLDRDYGTEIEILRSRSVLEPIVAIISAKYPEINYQKLVSDRGNSALKIERLKNTDILEVFYEDKNPEITKYVLDNLAAGYLNYSLQARKTAIESGLVHLEGELPIATQKVNELHQKHQEFKQKYNLLQPKKQAEILTKKIVELEEKYFNTQVELNEKKSLYLILEKQLGQNVQTAIASSHLSESSRYQELLDRLQQIEIKLANGASVWKANSPMLVNLQEKKAQLLGLLNQQARASLGNNIPANLDRSVALTSTSSLRLKLNQQFILVANEIEILNYRIMALAEAIRRLNQKIAEMPAIVAEHNQLERQLNSATQNLHNLSAQKEQLKLEAAKQPLVWQPISRAELPDKPIAPNRIKILSFGLIIGLFFGAIAAFLADRNDILDREREYL